MSDVTIQARTGRDWAHWVETLDAQQAHTWEHAKIARFVYENFDVSGWWSQSVTVGYERIKGRREIGQRSDGRYEAGRSKTVPVPVSRAYQAVASPRIRKKWLPDVKLTVRAATPDRSVRFNGPDGTSVTVWLEPKGEKKATLTVTHAKLPSRDDAARWKAYWGERLNTLAELLGGG